MPDAATAPPAASAIRPSFVNVGPGRSGTSWLLDMLRAHPEVAMARVKETEFFNTNHAEGTDWYLSHFEEAGRAVGEISNMYYVDTDVAARIHAFDPEMRIIFNLRRPRELLASMAGFGVRRGMTPGDPALLDAPIGQVMGSGFDARHKAGAATRGDLVPLSEAALLSRYVEPFRAVFPDSRIYYLIYDRIAAEPAALLSELYDFLGVDAGIVPEGADRVVNAAIKPRSRMIGALAPRVAQALRSMGAYGLLSRLHRSTLIKRVFYSQPPEKKADAVLPPLSAALDAELAAEEARLIALVPDLARFWTAGERAA